MRKKALDSLRVLCVEDEEASALLYKKFLEREGFSATVVSTGREFLSALSEETPDICVVDLNLPDTSGLQLLQELNTRQPRIPAIVLSGSDSLQSAVEAMKRGAMDYLSKPIEGSRLAVTLRNVMQLADYEQVIVRLRADVAREYSLDHLVGRSAVMDECRSLVKRAAASDASILILGESGTGKELVARAIHAASPRSDGPFSDINCAALTDTLLESELFGHEQGAFTGAARKRRGEFEQAHGGSLFLDELGDMPLPAQAKILRVLEERRVKPVGGERARDVDVRIIAATNKDLEKNVRDGTFREDLLYRVNTVTIPVPPLREREGDIPLLAEHFLVRACQRQKRGPLRFAPATLEQMNLHSWPGNVRELLHVIERAVILCEGETIEPVHLPPAIGGTAPGTQAAPKSKNLLEAVEQLEQSMILEALEKNAWIKSRAARALGITDRILSYKMDNLGIQKPEA